MENENEQDMLSLEESSSDEEIEKKEVAPKAKRQQTEKQKEYFRIARQKRMDNIAKNNEAKNIKKQEEKVIIEAKIVKKAVAIKKKQINKQYDLFKRLIIYSKTLTVNNLGTTIFVVFLLCNPHCLKC